MKLHADVTQRASCNIHDLAWEGSPAIGVQRRRIEQSDDNPPVERVTTVVRFAPKSTFSSHMHGGGEEFLVLDGVFSDQYGDYPAGYYLRNPKGTAHTPHSDEGCTILVKLWQMHPDDQQQVAINTRDFGLWEKDATFGEILPLFTADYESVCMMKWSAGAAFARQEFPAGAEYYILHGAFSDEQGEYAEGAWLRLPPGSSQTIQVQEDCLLLRKIGHLLHPVSYV